MNDGTTDKYYIDKKIEDYYVYGDNKICHPLNDNKIRFDKNIEKWIYIRNDKPVSFDGINTSITIDLSNYFLFEKKKVEEILNKLPFKKAKVPADRDSSHASFILKRIINSYLQIDLKLYNYYISEKQIINYYVKKGFITSRKNDGSYTIDIDLDSYNDLHKKYNIDYRIRFLNDPPEHKKPVISEKQQLLLDALHFEYFSIPPNINKKPLFINGGPFFHESIEAIN